MSSPCIGLCELDDEGVCKGCDRTMEEIVQAGQPEEE